MTAQAPRVHDPVTGEDITDAAVRCRSYGHAWDEVANLPGKAGLRMVAGFQIHLRCMRCTTVRHDVWNLAGGLAARYYEYPDGYRTAGDDKLSRDEYRLLIIRARRRRRSGSAA